MVVVLAADVPSRRDPLTPLDIMFVLKIRYDFALTFGFEQKCPLGLPQQHRAECVSIIPELDSYLLIGIFLSSR